MHDVARRRFLTGGAGLAAALVGAGRPARRAGAPVSAGPADPKLIEDLVAANRSSSSRASSTAMAT